MLLVGESSRTSELDGAWHHEPGVLADVAQEPDDFRVPCVPTKPKPRQVAPFRK